MEETITKMIKSLGTFCNNIQSSSQALKQSVDRRPIPLDSASTTFIQSLNRRVSELSTDLNVLESMTLGTVSFEELLGHCHQIYKQNQSDGSILKDRLRQLGYLHSGEILFVDPLRFFCVWVILLSRIKDDHGFDEFEEDFMVQSVSIAEPESQLMNSFQGCGIKDLDDDSLFDESLSLQSLGLSEICLATLASEGDRKIDVLDSPPKLSSMKVHCQDDPKFCNTISGKEGDKTELLRDPKLMVVSEEDYENLPSYMKTLAPWEDLQSAVEKMNSFLGKKGNSKQSYFHPDELESMGLGSKGRSYLLLLVRMKRLCVETNDGLISYRVL